MESDVEESSNLMMRRLTPVATLVPISHVNSDHAI